MISSGNGGEWGNITNMMLDFEDQTLHLGSSIDGAPRECRRGYQTSDHDMIHANNTEIR